MFLRQLLLEKNKRRAVIIAHDLAMVWLCWQGLHALRYATLEQIPIMQPFNVEVLLILLIQALVFHYVGLYRGMWRFASMADLINILKASFIGLFLIMVALLLYNRLQGVPRTVLLLWPWALTALLGGSRLLYRIWRDWRASVATSSASRVLILGAGQTAEALIKDLRRSNHYQPVGLLDDNPQLKGARLQEIPVVGSLEDITHAVRKISADMLVIAIPSLDATRMQRVLTLCESSGLPFKKVPRLIDILDGHAQPGQLKDIAIEDLLGRDPVQPDWQQIRHWLSGRSVLITGAGGSIGSELCRQCARNGIAKIILFEISEILLLTIYEELHQQFPDLLIECVLGDCADPALVAHALRTHCPDTVFHAAAYKQVPLLETQVRAAVRNNVLATECVARACLEQDISHFVLVSTDKAVAPINALGASKRYAEMICQRLNQHAITQNKGIRFVTVRFGNVLDSVGSVVPLFREQIRKGGPVTVTDPEVSRYFMTIPEACLLILQAVAGSTRGAIYMLDMGQPVLIRVLAEQMIRLAGKQVGKEIAITYSGLRPGEKLHESLLYSHENSRPTAHPKVLEAITADLPPGQVLGNLGRLQQAVSQFDMPAIYQILASAIPEYGAAQKSASQQVSKSASQQVSKQYFPPFPLDKSP